MTILDDPNKNHVNYSRHVKLNDEKIDICLPNKIYFPIGFKREYPRLHSSPQTQSKKRSTPSGETL